MIFLDATTAGTVGCLHHLYEIDQHRLHELRYSLGDMAKSFLTKLPSEITPQRSLSQFSKCVNQQV